ncbi:GDSL-type esterase/lipase family protein [Methylobacterium sp. WSM2598]|uniref:GDSL-type esterase/lipase family protein n=1 Tax=Methylobacterium sp. WSM2598 TaxID=398261 RepID=UPI000363862F|nr:GDSL-type esterase/lipase family protein [Methylobacterium sp. WSM2598]
MRFVRSSRSGARRLLGAGPVLAALAGPVAAKPVVLGDSIGVGIAAAAGAPRLAHNSVAIRGDDALQQIRRTAPGSLALLSLGTNDAVGGARDVAPAIDRLVAAARAGRLRLVWVGPPCVFKPWNAEAARLDAILRGRLGGEVTYVSLADRAICDRRLRAADGVHFTAAGYALIWRVQAAVGIAPARPVAGSVAAGPALRPVLP